MKDISEIDINFKVGSDLQKDGIKFYNSIQKPFKVYGVFYEGGKYRRMPESVAKNISEGVYSLHNKTAGGRVRFKTNSSYIAISATMENMSMMSHFANTGCRGFDLYAENEYIKTFVPPVFMETGYESLIELGTNKMREITINFPSYSGVNDLYIGIEKNTILEEASPYVNEKPIVYYGSSITQGGCASRPGMIYQNIISRRFNCDYVNLGFSGCARAENEIIEYIKMLDMSAFIYDYDHNAPTLEHLRDTHEKMFKAIREKNPLIPIIIMTRPKFKMNEEEEERRKIIEKTYSNAASSGDNNVYYVDGKALTAMCRNEGTVDGVHPTDYGFASMAKALGDIMELYNII